MLTTKDSPCSCRLSDGTPDAYHVHHGCRNRLRHGALLGALRSCVELLTIRLVVVCRRGHALRLCTAEL